MCVLQEAIGDECAKLRNIQFDLGAALEDALGGGLSGAAGSCIVYCLVYDTYEPI